MITDKNNSKAHLIHLIAFFQAYGSKLAKIILNWVILWEHI